VWLSGGIGTRNIVERLRRVRHASGGSNKELGFRKEERGLARGSMGLISQLNYKLNAQYRKQRGDFYIALMAIALDVNELALYFM
jgi:hypothetical protein